MLDILAVGSPNKDSVTVPGWWMYINHKRGTQSLASQREVDQILFWMEPYVPTLSTVHIPDMENWQVDFLNVRTLEIGLCPQGFQELSSKW